MVFPSSSGDMPIVAYRKMWLRIAKLGGLPADIMPHVLRHSFASLAALILDITSRPSPAYSATRPIASPAGTCIPPMPWRMPPPVPHD